MASPFEHEQLGQIASSYVRNSTHFNVFVDPVVARGTPIWCTSFGIVPNLILQVATAEINGRLKWIKWWAFYVNQINTRSRDNL